MKKLLIISLLLLTCTIIFAQDKEPNAWEFRWGKINTPRVFDLDEFKQDTFHFGFQWAASKLMNDSLRNTAYATHGFLPELNNNKSPLRIINQPRWWDAGYNISAWNAPFMTYEPTLPLSSSGDNFGQILRPDDESNPIFGFKNRRVEPSTNPTDINYSRMVLTDNLVSNDSIVVLENIMPQPRFKSRTFDIFKRGGQTDNYLGKKWFLCV